MNKTKGKELTHQFIYGRTPFTAVFPSDFESETHRDILLKVSAIKEMHDYLFNQKSTRGHSSLRRGTSIDVSYGSMKFADNFVKFFSKDEVRSIIRAPIDHIIAGISSIETNPELVKLVGSINNKSKWLGEIGRDEIEFLAFEFFKKDRFSVADLRIISRAVSSFNSMFRTAKSKEELKGNETTYLRKYFSGFLHDAEEVFKDKEDK